MTHAPARLLLPIASLAVAVALAGCGSLPSLNPFKKEEERLPGERISVLKPDDGPAVDQGAAKRPIALPDARRNATWSQPGGVASNAPGHLSIGGATRAAWRISVGKGSSSSGRMTASPIVVGGKIFTLDAEGNVSAFSVSSGSRLWRTPLVPENEKSREGYGGGLAADDGRIYATTGFGTAVALNPASGAVIWSRKIGVPIRTSPTAAGGKLFFVTSESRTYCLQGSDGSELWSSRGLPEAATLLSNVSPAISGDTVVVPYPSGEVAALKVKSGQSVWIESLSRRRSSSALAALSDPARPVVDRGVVFAVSHGGRMIATAKATGERLWTKSISSTQAPWAAGNWVFVVDVNGKLMALARNTGQVHWVTELPQATKWSGPILASGKLWLASSKGLVVGVDAATGQVASQTDLDTDVYVAPIVAEGRMYVLTDAARLVALN